MGLLADLTEEFSVERKCRFGEIRELLASSSTEELQALDDAVSKIRSDERMSRSKVYSNQWLSDILTKNGYSISRATVSRHVNKECSCGV